MKSYRDTIKKLNIEITENDRSFIISLLMLVLAAVCVAKIGPLVTNPYRSLSMLIKNDMDQFLYATSTIIGIGLLFVGSFKRKKSVIIVGATMLILQIVFALFQSTLMIVSNFNIKSLVLAIFFFITYIIYTIGLCWLASLTVQRSNTVKTKLPIATIAFSIALVSLANQANNLYVCGGCGFSGDKIFLYYLGRIFVTVSALIAGVWLIYLASKQLKESATFKGLIKFILYAWPLIIFIIYCYMNDSHRRSWNLVELSFSDFPENLLLLLYIPLARIWRPQLILFLLAFLWLAFKATKNFESHTKANQTV